MSNEPVKPPRTIGIDSDSEGLYFYLGNLHVIMLIAAFLSLLLINIGLVALTILAYFYNYFQLLSVYAIALILQFFMIIGAHIVWTGLAYSQTILKHTLRQKSKKDECQRSHAGISYDRAFTRPIDDKRPTSDELSEKVIKKIFPSNIKKKIAVSNVS